MDSFIFAINAVLPIILVVASGYLLKRIGLMSDSFATASNKLVFRIFLPVMLFLNTYKINAITDIKFDYIIYVVSAMLIVFGISIPLCVLVAKKRKSRGVLLQGCFRSNYAHVGIPLTQSLFGEAGVMIATLLSAVLIPLINILAVISLSIFGEDGKERPSVKNILVGVLKNPLIQAVLLGVGALIVRSFFVRWDISFRLSSITPVYTALEYIARIATPLALLGLGAQFEFSAISSLRREIIFGTLMRTVLVPTLCLSVAAIFFGDRFGGAHFAAFVAAFASPLSISTVPMTQEMGGDTTLAGQLVIWTTVSSGLTIFLISFILRSVGIF